MCLAILPSSISVLVGIPSPLLNDYYGIIESEVYFLKPTSILNTSLVTPKLYAISLAYLSKVFTITAV
jgi:hypothetical protein